MKQDVIENDYEKLKNQTTEKETNVLMMNHKRTKLEESELQVDIRDVAQRLEEKGYLVRVKPGGHLLVQDKNLSPQNSITITRKNAYLEDANIQSQSAIELYKELKKNVLDTVDESFSSVKDKKCAIENSTEFSGISVFQISKDLVMEHMQNAETAENVDLNAVFADSKTKYQFLDEKGKEFLSLALEYKVNDDKEKSVVPVISVKYGEEYGDFKKSFGIEKASTEAIGKDQFHKTDLVKEIEDFAKIGGRERSSEFVLLKAAKVKNILDKEISKEFKFLNPDKIEYFSSVALDYYSRKPDYSLAEYEINQLKEAPFYRAGMSSSKILNTLMDSFTYIEQKIEDPGLDSVIERSMQFDDFSCRVYKDGALAMDTRAKEPVTYDREWINKLARLEDSVMELRYGPVQDIVNIASSLGKGTKELADGIASYQSEGLYSGFDIGGGIDSFREGWKYGAVISQMERDYKQLFSSSDEKDKIAAIDKKMDLKLLRDDIHDNTNIYIKAAMILRTNCDRMLDSIRELKDSKNNNTLSESKLQMAKNRFIEYSKRFVASYNQIKNAVSNIEQDLRKFLDQKQSKAIDTLDYTKAKTKAIFNAAKDTFNDISKKAQVILDMKAFTGERIAEQLNDIKVMNTFGTLAFDDFGQETKLRFWEELDSSIKAGEDAEKIPREERTSEDIYSIRFGEKMKYQKEQNLFVAESIRGEINNCYKEKLPYSEVIEQLARTYNNESMAFRLRNTESSIRNYSELSEADKFLCRDVVKDLVHTMPSLEEAFLDNERDLEDNKDIDKDQDKGENDL